MPETSPILSVRDLKVSFHTDGRTVRAVDGVSFDLAKGETLGVVGESGSGKSVMALSLLRLAEARTEGTINFGGQDILRLSEREIRKIRTARAAMVFQNPASSLNPYLKISKQLAEITRLHLGHSRRQAHEHAVGMLEAVAIADAASRADNYPHEFSGGMLQRVCIAMALSCEPELLIADEPTTALDVTIQAQILDLIKNLKAKMGTSVILITHDLGVIAGMADNVIVMYAGRIFEQAASRELFAAPANPYTRGLLRSMPDPLAEPGAALYQIPGVPPNPASLPPGCPFADRCYRAQDICRRKAPPLTEVGPGHKSLCHFAAEVYAEAAENRR